MNSKSSIHETFRRPAGNTGPSPGHLRESPHETFSWSIQHTSQSTTWLLPSARRSERDTEPCGTGSTQQSTQACCPPHRRQPRQQATALCRVSCGLCQADLLPRSLRSGGTATATIILLVYEEFALPNSSKKAHDIKLFGASG